MNKSIDKKRIASRAVFMIGVLAVLFYIVIGQKAEFDSDFTDTVIWAKAMLTGNGIFDPNMSYAYTLPFGGSLLMAPFVAVFGMSYTAHVLGFVLFFGIFVVVLYKAFKAMDFSDNESMVAVGFILLLSLPSKEVRMTMWGHVIHYSLGFLFVLIGLIIVSKIDFSAKLGLKAKKNVIWIIVLMVFSAFCCTNGLTIILFFLIPFAGAVITERFVDVENPLKSRFNIDTFVIGLLCIMAGGIGFVLSMVMQRNITTVYDGMFKTIPMWQHWIWDITERLRTFIMCTCGEISSDVLMESFTGIRIMYMALVGMVIIIVPFVAGVSYKNIGSRIAKLMIISYYILLFATLFVFDFSMARGTAHRLTGVYMTAVTVSVMYMIWLTRSAKFQRFGYLLFAGFTIAAMFCLYSVSTLRYENRFSKLAEVLEENGLKYGYAEYWSAQVTTVLSNDNVEVASIDIKEDGTVTKKEYNTFADQFEGKENVDSYFVFLSKWEYDAVKNTLCEQAVDCIQFDENGYILIFSENVF